MTRLGIFILLFAISLPARAGLLVTDVAGGVETDAKAPVPLLSELAEGATLVLAPGARLVAVELAGGKEYLLRGPGRYKAEKAGLRAIKGAPAEVKPLPVANLPSVRVASGALSQATLVMRSMPVMNVPVPLHPVRTAILTAMPVLRWSAVAGAETYRVTIADADGRTVFESVLQETELALGPDAALAPGARYAWRVEARSPRGRFSDASAEFSVLPADLAALLEALRPSPDAPYARRVLYAAQLHEAGASAEAKAAWKALSAERPEDERIRSLAE